MNFKVYKVDLCSLQNIKTIINLLVGAFQLKLTTWDNYLTKQCLELFS